MKIKHENVINRHRMPVCGRVYLTNGQEKYFM